VGCATLTVVPASAAGEKLVPIGSVNFVASPEWYLIDGAQKDGDTLVFRKYGLAYVDGILAGPDKVKNIIDFGCQSNSRYYNYSVFHFADWMSVGFDRTKWLPHISLSIGLDNLKQTYQADAEYKNNALFIDLNEQTSELLTSTLDAGQISVDYGGAWRAACLGAARDRRRRRKCVRTPERFRHTTYCPIGGLRKG